MLLRWPLLIDAFRFAGDVKTDLRQYQTIFVSAVFDDDDAPSTLDMATTSLTPTMITTRPCAPNDHKRQNCPTIIRARHRDEDAKTEPNETGAHADKETHPKSCRQKQILQSASCLGLGQVDSRRWARVHWPSGCSARDPWASRCRSSPMSSSPPSGRSPGSLVSLTLGHGWVGSLVSSLHHRRPRYLSSTGYAPAQCPSRSPHSL
jgi:hypothetical protein